MGRLLVTLGTDGTTDWVRTPDGYKFNLGPVSALNFVLGLAPRGTAKRALSEFLAQKEVLFPVDEGAMWTLLAPHRPRWSSDVSSSIPPVNEEPTARKGTMAFSDDLKAIETHITALKAASAKKAANLSSGVQHLIKLAQKIKSPHQSENSTYYNLGAPDVHQVGDKTATGLSFDVYTSNSELAKKILAKTDSTLKTIDKLATAGRKFNASRARLDVQTITDKVAGILTTDVTQSWVKSDLDKLAARADQIHGLFANAKV